VRAREEEDVLLYEVSSDWDWDWDWDWLDEDSGSLPRRRKDREFDVKKDVPYGLRRRV